MVARGMGVDMIATGRAHEVLVVAEQVARLVRLVITMRVRVSMRVVCVEESVRAVSQWLNVRTEEPMPDTHHGQRWPIQC